jgi:hypothetical protein
MLFVFGLGVGTFGTMLGVGGGWIHVPFLLLVYSFSPQLAIGTSIGVIFCNTLSGSITYYSQKRLDVALARRLAPAVIPGALVGPFIVQTFAKSVFFIAFAVVLVLVALYLFFLRPPGAAQTSSRGLRPRAAELSLEQRYRMGVVGTLLIGFISNIFGIGGGIIHVPFLILLLGVPTHVALGTSHFILCVSSGIGTLVYAIMGYVQVDFMMPIAAGTILGAPLGAELARRVDEVLIRRVLVVLLLFLSLRMAYTGIEQRMGEVPIVHHVPGHDYMPVPVSPNLDVKRLRPGSRPPPRPGSRSL